MNKNKRLALFNSIWDDIKSGKKKFIGHCENLGDDINLTSYASGDSCCYSLIQWAAKNNRVDYIEKLIELGCNVDLYDRIYNPDIGHNAFNLACLNRRIDVGMAVVKALLKVGKVNNASKLFFNGINAFRHNEENSKSHYGVDYFDIAKLLISFGIDVDASVNHGSGETPLMLATSAGNFKIVELLLNSGCNPLKGDRTRRNAMHYGALSNSLSCEIVDILIEAGITIDCKTREGFTPLFIAVSTGLLNNAKIFLERGADINSRDTAGRTPIFISASSLHTDLFSFLVEKGADLTVVTNDGETLSEYLMEYKDLYGFFSQSGNIHSHLMELIERYKIMNESTNTDIADKAASRKNRIVL